MAPDDGGCAASSGVMPRVAIVGGPAGIVEDDHRRIEARDLERRVENAVEELLELDGVAEVVQEPVALALALRPLEGIGQVAAEIVHARAHVVDRAGEPVVARRVGAAPDSEERDQPSSPKRAAATITMMMVVPLEMFGPPNPSPSAM